MAGYKRRLQLILGVDNKCKVSYSVDNKKINTVHKGSTTTIYREEKNIALLLDLVSSTYQVLTKFQHLIQTFDCMLQL